MIAVVCCVHGARGAIWISTSCFAALSKKGENHSLILKVIVIVMISLIIISCIIMVKAIKFSFLQACCSGWLAPSLAFAWNVVSWRKRVMMVTAIAQCAFCQVRWPCGQNGPVYATGPYHVAHVVDTGP